MVSVGDQRVGKASNANYLQTTSKYFERGNLPEKKVAKEKFCVTLNFNKVFNLTLDWILLIS